MPFTVELKTQNNTIISGNLEQDLMYLRYIECYLNDLLKIRGYVYLNQICESLGVEWNPDDLNMIIRSGYHTRIILNICVEEDGYIVHINY